LKLCEGKYLLIYLYLKFKMNVHKEIFLNFEKNTQVKTEEINFAREVEVKSKDISLNFPKPRGFTISLPNILAFS
jgi:hypothetical protein